MLNLREDLNRKKTFSFGHCPNHLTPPPDPNSRNLVLFFWTSKTTFCAHDRFFLIMIMMVSMIIMMIIMAILMIIMTEMSKKHTITY